MNVSAKLTKLKRSPLTVVGVILILAVVLYNVLIKAGINIFGGANFTSFTDEGKTVKIPLNIINETFANNPDFQANLIKWRDLDFFKTQLPTYYEKYNAWYAAATGNQEYTISGVDPKTNQYAVDLATIPVKFVANMLVINNATFLNKLNKSWQRDLGVPIYLSIFYFLKDQKQIDLIYNHFKKLNDFVKNTFDK